MRTSRVRQFVLAALAVSSLSLAACASDEDVVTAEQADELAVQSDELVAPAAAPSLTMGTLIRCVGGVLNVSGEVKTSASSFTLKFNGLPISAPGGYFSFNPGGSGTLVAKACNGSACATRSRFIQWVPCNGGGGGVEP